MDGLPLTAAIYCQRAAEMRQRSRALGAEIGAVFLDLASNYETLANSVEAIEKSNRTLQISH